MKNKDAVCRSYSVHEDIILTVQDTMPKEEQLYDLADFFKMFGDATRIKILQALLVSEMCVCDLSEILSVSQSAVSHQLKTLRQANLVSYRKEGKSAVYFLKDHHVKLILTLGVEHIEE